MIRLSIIILSHNTKAITLRCIDSLRTSILSVKHTPSEVVIIDNASQDGSDKELLSYAQDHASESIIFRVVLNKDNVGFTKGNNQGLDLISGTYCLFLNSDVIVSHVDWDRVLDYLDSNPEVGALTVRVNLESGLIDPASHRGFPTIANSLFYFSKLEQMTSRMPFMCRIFGGYHLTYKPLDSIHEIDSPTGAFFLSPTVLLKKLRGFDEDYFMYGEDLDLAFRIKSLHKKIVYYPSEVVTHLKYRSGLSNKSTKSHDETRSHFFQSMKIFYRKHYASQHVPLLNEFVYRGIDVLSLIYKRR